MVCIQQVKINNLLKCAPGFPVTWPVFSNLRQHYSIYSFLKRHLGLKTNTKPKLCWHFTVCTWTELFKSLSLPKNRRYRKEKPENDLESSCLCFHVLWLQLEVANRQIAGGRHSGTDRGVTQWPEMLLDCPFLLRVIRGFIHPLPFYAHERKLKGEGYQNMNNFRSFWIYCSGCFNDKDKLLSLHRCLIWGKEEMCLFHLVYAR